MGRRRQRARSGASKRARNIWLRVDLGLSARRARAAAETSESPASRHPIPRLRGLGLGGVLQKGFACRKSCVAKLPREASPNRPRSRRAAGRAPRRPPAAGAPRGGRQRARLREAARRAVQRARGAARAGRLCRPALPAKFTRSPVGVLIACSTFSAGETLFDSGVAPPPSQGQP
jgi:hypothetical protein